MEIIQTILSDRLLTLAVATVIMTPIGYLVLWYCWPSVRKSERSEPVVTSMLSTLPPLDITLMHKVPTKPKEMEANRGMGMGGTFGISHFHMVVTDRDGQPYYCLMNDYNCSALARSGFIQTSREPRLSCGHDCFELDGKHFDVYPEFLRKYPRNDPHWIRWVKIRRNFENFLQTGGSPYRSFEKYLLNEARLQIVQPGTPTVTI